MSSAILQGGASGTGSMTVLAPNTNSNQIVTIPDATGTVMVSSNMPAFSAYRSGTNQSISASTWTKVQCQTKEFDTATAYDNSTNYRFQPLIAGYYQISACINFTFTGSSTILGADIYKNGSSFKGNQLWLTASAGTCVTCSALVYLNGSTDYIELYGYCNATSPTFNVSSDLTYFQATMVRTA